MFFCIWELDIELHGGGFAQYHHNASGSILSRLHGLFSGNGPSTEQKARRGQLGSIKSNALSELSNNYLKYPDKLYELLYDHLRAHRTEIRGARAWKCHDLGHTGAATSASENPRAGVPTGAGDRFDRMRPSPGLSAAA